MQPFTFGASELTVSFLISATWAVSTLRHDDGNASRGHALFEAPAIARAAMPSRKRTACRSRPGDIGALRTAELIHRTLIDPAGSMLPANRPVHA